MPGALRGRGKDWSARSRRRGKNRVWSISTSQAETMGKPPLHFSPILFTQALSRYKNEASLTFHRFLMDGMSDVLFFLQNLI